MSKKVVHLTTVHSWQDSRIFQKECKSLSEKGYEVHLIAKDGIDKEVDGIHIHSLKKPYSKTISRILFAPKYAWKQAMDLKPNIIHFHDPELIRGSFEAHEKGIKVVYDIHEDNLSTIKTRSYIPGWLTGPLSNVIKNFETKAHTTYATVVAEDYYQERFPEAVKLRNYPKLSDLGDLGVKKQKTKYINCLYTGTIDIPRGALNHARLHSEDIKVTMIGKCSEKTYHQIAEIVGEDIDQVIPFGHSKFIPFESIREAYHFGTYSIGLAVFPESEHYARKRLTKFYEYMAFGLPILCTDFPEWKAFVESNHLGKTINPANSDGIIEAIHQLQKDYEAEGEKLVINQYNWEKEVENLYYLYNKVFK